MEDYILGIDESTFVEDGQQEDSEADEEESEEARTLREKAERKAERKRRRAERLKGSEHNADIAVENVVQAEESIEQEAEAELEADVAPVKKKQRTKTSKSTSAAPPSPPPTDAQSETPDKIDEPIPLKELSSRRSPAPASAGPGPTSLNSMQARKRKRSSVGSGETKYGGYTLDEVKMYGKQEGWTNTFLASKWLRIAGLRELEQAGAIKYKRGKWNSQEERLIQSHLESFQKANRLNDEELVEVIMSKKGKESGQDDKSEYAKFWLDMAAEVPGRPVKYVKDHVQRRYNPHGHKGAWTETEDRALNRAYAIHPDQWSKIARSVERTEADCRDRWRDSLRDSETKTRGKWTLSEESQLLSIVKEVNGMQGRDAFGGECDWEIVRVKMGGARTRLQIRKKWQDDLRHRATDGGAHVWGAYQRFKLLESLSNRAPKSESDIDWDSISQEGWTDASSNALRIHWNRLKLKIEPSKTLPFSKYLAGLVKLHPEPRGQKRRGPSQSSQRSQRSSPAGMTTPRRITSREYISDDEKDDEESINPVLEDIVQSSPVPVGHSEADGSIETEERGSDEEEEGEEEMEDGEDDESGVGSD